MVLTRIEDDKGFQRTRRKTRTPLREARRTARKRVRPCERDIIAEPGNTAEAELSLLLRRVLPAVIAILGMSSATAWHWAVAPVERIEKNQAEVKLRTEFMLRK